MPQLKVVKELPSQEALEAYLLNKLRVEAAKMAYQQTWDLGKKSGLKGRELNNAAWDASQKAERDAVELMRKIWEESGIQEVE